MRHKMRKDRLIQISRYRFYSQFVYLPHKQRWTSHLCAQAAQTNLDSDSYLMMQNITL